MTALADSCERSPALTFLLVVLASAGAGIRSSASSVPFDFQSSYTPLATPGQSNWVASADFDGDHIVDLVSANLGSAGVSVFLARDRLQASARRDIDLVADARCVVTGDFNDDRAVDIAVLHVRAPGLWISVLTGNGHGEFEIGTSLEVVQTFQPTHPFGNLVAHDLDGDGALDLAAATAEAFPIGSLSTLLVWYGDGSGAFETPMAVPVGRTPMFVACRGDLDSDGYADLVLGYYYTNFVDLLLGYARGSFRRVGLACRWGARSIAIEDFNRDSMPDIAVATETNVTVLSARGGGLYAPGTILDTRGTPMYMQSVAAADLDSDGDVELVAAWDDGLFSVYEGTDKGLARPGVDFAAGAFSKAVVTGDFDGDGHVDVALSSGGLCVLLGNGDRTFGNDHKVMTPSPAFDAGIGDVDGDGKLDLVSLHRHPSTDVRSALLVHRGLGGRRFDAGLPTILVGLASKLALADLDSNGDLDLVTVAFDSLRTWRGHGNGRFARVAAYSASNVRFTRFADLDRDGHVDLVSGDLVVRFWRGLGDGTFAVPVSLGGFSQCAVNDLAIMDVDADGYADIVSSFGSSYHQGGRSGAIGIVRARADGGLEPQTFVDLGGWSAGAFAIGNVNADTALDIVMSQYLPRERGSQYRLAILPGLAPGEFGPPIVRGGWAARFHLYDFDHDGIDELVEMTSSVRVSRIGVDGALTAERDLGAGIAPSRLEHADLDGDSRVDFFVVNARSDYLSVLWNNGDVPAPVAFADLAASPDDIGIQVRWRLDAIFVPRVRFIVLERATNSTGPYAPCTAAPLAPQLTMSVHDTAVVAGATYWYRCVMILHDGTREASTPVAATMNGRFVTGLAVAFESQSGASVVVHYVTRGPDPSALLEVFDVRGRVVRRMFPQPAAAGLHVHTWDRRDAAGRRVPRGVYVLRLVSLGDTAHRKIPLLH